MTIGDDPGLAGNGKSASLQPGHNEHHAGAERDATDPSGDAVLLLHLRFVSPSLNITSLE
jgi:hypothetical protein